MKPNFSPLKLIIIIFPLLVHTLLHMLILFWRAQHDHLNTSKHNHLPPFLYSFNVCSFSLKSCMIWRNTQNMEREFEWAFCLSERVTVWVWLFCRWSIHTNKNACKNFVCTKRDTFICGRMYAMVFDLIMLLMPVLRSILFLWITFYTFECKIGISNFTLSIINLEIDE